MSLSRHRDSKKQLTCTERLSVRIAISSSIRSRKTDVSLELNASEATYFTNRAAAYMALKRFKPALLDCQQAANLQSASPSPKTLVRLARCQLSTGSTAPALSTLRTVLAIDSKNAPALQLQKKVEDLEGHLKRFESAKGKKEWGMARLALDKCVQAIESEGGDIPSQWRVWRVELEMARGNWDSAGIAAKYVYHQTFFVCDTECSQRIAMPYDWNLTRQTSLPCVVPSSSFRQKVCQPSNTCLPHFG